MIKYLSNNGNAWHIYLTKPILQLLNANPLETKFLLTIKNKTLIISKISEDKILKLENPLVKRIRKAGSGYGIFLGQTILELIDVNPEVDMVDISIEEQTLIVKKAVR